MIHALPQAQTSWKTSALSQTKTFAKGKYIFSSGDFANKIYLVESGRIKVNYLGESGKQMTKEVLDEGDLFGVEALIGMTYRRDFAIAMESTVVRSFGQKEIKRLLFHYPDLNALIIEVLGKRMVHMETRLESLVLKDSRTRIIEFLYQLGLDKGQRVGYEVVVRKFMTHQDTANLTATARQTVTTTLNELRYEKILTFNRRRLLIRDMDRLRAVAQANHM